MNWKTACKIAAPAVACAGAFAFLVAPGRATRAQKAPFLYRNYAHRGLHTEDGTVPENSLPAFRAAAEAGYAVEMDVHLTADDQLVVFHDDTLERMSGVPGVIDDFTLAERRALRLGDTDCVIPTFAEALEALGGRVPLLLEVKRGHNNRRLCALTLAALRTYGGPYCVESFDPTIVAWFRRNAPDILRGQLSQPPKDYGKALNKPAAAIVGNVLTNVIADRCSGLSVRRWHHQYVLVQLRHPDDFPELCQGACPEVVQVLPALDGHLFLVRVRFHGRGH